MDNRNLNQDVQNQEPDNQVQCGQAESGQAESGQAENTQAQRGEGLPGSGKIPPVILKSRELKYTGTILKFYEDTVIANGHEEHWDFIHHDGAAAVVAVADDGKLLMVRQYRNALNRETLEIPAGKLDAPDEPKIECAYRELEEETGFRCEKLEYLMSLNTTVAFCDEFIDVFVARNLIPSKQNLDEDEVINVEAWEVEDLEELIWSGKITDAKTVAAITAYARKYCR